MKCADNRGPILLLKAICVLIVVLGFVVPAKAARQYDYIATTKAARAKPAPVNTGKLVWNCEGNQCRIRGPLPMPSVSACRALAKKVGFILRYEHAGRYLSKAELNKCNEGIMVENPIDRRAEQRSVQNPTPTARASTTEVDAPLRERASEAMRAKSPDRTPQVRPQADRDHVQNPALSVNAPAGQSFKQPVDRNSAPPAFNRTEHPPTPRPMGIQPIANDSENLPPQPSGAMKAKSPYSTSQVRPPANQGDVQNPALTSKLREARKAQRNEDQRFLQARDRLREGHVIIDAGSITVFLR